MHTVWPSPGRRSPTRWGVPGLFLSVVCGCTSPGEGTYAGWQSIRKLGTVDCDMVETTPVVFRGRLYRFESVRAGHRSNPTEKSFFRLVDVATGEATPSFAEGHHLGCAFVEGDAVYVYGVEAWGASRIDVFRSNDLKTWTSQPALERPGWGIFNTSVCRGPKGYVMAIELDKPPEEVGVGFTNRFAVSDDLLHWKPTGPECVFAKDRYTACPTLRYLDGFCYVVYLETKPGPAYETFIVRSNDLVHWDSSPLNPVLRASAEDKPIVEPRLTAGQRARIAGAVDRNNSDLDFCEFGGKVAIFYSWGNQEGVEFLGRAEYEGSMEEFLRGFFPKSP